jgi:hypothetical protein
VKTLKSKKSDPDYDFVRDDESGENKSMLSADYGEEGEQDVYGD